MLKSSLLRASVAVLTTLGLMLSAPHVQAAPQPGQKLVVQTTDAKVIDIGLKEQGVFQGRVVDHAGTPVRGAEVIVRQGQKEIAKLSTDEHGRFAVKGLKGGVYEVGSGKTMGAFRVWQEASAPPAAKEQALIILGQNGERGAIGGMGGGVLLLTAVALTALVLSIIALDECNDDTPDSP